MDGQIIIVAIIVAVCGFFAFRRIKRELSGQDKCSCCKDKHSKPLHIDPPLNRHDKR